MLYESEGLIAGKRRVAKKFEQWLLLPDLYYVSKRGYRFF